MATMNDEADLRDGEKNSPYPTRASPSYTRFVVGALCVGLISSVACVIGLAVWGSKAANGCPIKVPPRIGIWTQIVSTTGPSARLAHAAVDVDDSVMYVHGGMYGFTNITYGDLWRYTEANNSWMQITTTGDIPSPRFHHSLVNADDAHLILYGGFNVFNTQPQHDSYADVYSLDLATFVWTRLDTTTVGPRPPKRGAHDALFYGGNMFVFGGYQRIGGPETNEFWKYTFATNTWVNITPASAGSTPIISRYTYPAPRIGFAFTIVDDSAYMFGGGCPSGSLSADLGQCSDMWRYDFLLDTWTYIPPPAGLGKDDHPVNRRATNTDDAIGGIIYLFGGVNINATVPTSPVITMFDDFWAYDPSQNEWFEIHPNWDRPPKPPATFGNSVVRLNDKIVVFGGRVLAPTNPGSNQLWEYATIPPP